MSEKSWFQLLACLLTYILKLWFLCNYPRFVSVFVLFFFRVLILQIAIVSERDAYILLWSYYCGGRTL